MIRLAENLEALSMPCGSSPFGCQIRSKAQAYGFHQSFAQFWTDGEAAYGKTDGSVCIAGEITDADEARAFLSAVGTNEVVCSAENAEKLGLNITESGAILQKVLRNETVHPAEEISPREIYAVLKANGMVGEFEPFYLDLSHRMRHGTVRCAGGFGRWEDRRSGCSRARRKREPHFCCGGAAEISPQGAWHGGCPKNGANAAERHGVYPARRKQKRGVL